MTKVQKRTFSLTPEQSAFVDRKVASGDYASSSEVIREGLRAMQERDAAIERWLREKVVPTYDYMEQHPDEVLSVDEVFDALDAIIHPPVEAAE